jgi:membrane protease YdiL (CAAX protease family)
VRWGVPDALWAYLAGIGGAVLGLTVTGARPDDDRVVVLVAALVGQYGATFAVLVGVARRKGLGSLRADFGLRVDVHDWSALGVGVALQLALGAALLPIVHLVDESQTVVRDLDEASGAELWLLALTALLLAPVLEEVLFRGLLLRALLRRATPVTAVAVSALAFALVHPLLDPSLGSVAVLPGLLAVGLVTGVLAVRTGDLSRPILVHLGFNLLTVVGALQATHLLGRVPGTTG